MIKLENINKTFHTSKVETLALNNISLSVETGEFVAITGPSGCGKSTLLNIIGMLDSPNDGKYIFDGTNVAGLRESRLADVRKKNIGFIFQSFNLIDELTVEQNILLPLKYQRFDVQKGAEQLKNITERLNISHRLGHFPQQLSGGQQQRVAIARAFISKPKLILADEPTANLDSKNGSEVMEILAQLHSDGSTIIMVTHSPDQAELAGRQVRLHDGSILVESQSLKTCA